MWGAFALAVFFAVVLFLVFVRADKSSANGALIVLTLLAVGISLAATVRTFDENGGGTTGDGRLPQSIASMPAMSCLDGLAGDAVEIACERALFSSADSSAAAVSYTAAQITRLTRLGDEAAAGKAPELSALRRALERDRYGLVAHVLMVREGCTASECSFYKSVSNHNQIAANMTDQTYQGLIGRYAAIWSGTNTGSATATAMPPSIPSGKPMSGDFPSSSSIPAVNIMTPEPAAPSAASSKPPQVSPPPTTAAQPVPPRAATAPPAAKKLAAKKNVAAPAPSPVQLAPATPQSDDN